LAYGSAVVTNNFFGLATLIAWMLDEVKAGF
jgi:hypothetical protein